MRYDIIRKQNYLIVCNDIKHDGWCTCFFGDSDCKKIIAHHPLNGAPYLDGVPVIPPLPQEDDVKELFKEEYEQARKRGSQDYAEGYYGGLLDGHKQAREKYKYTEFNIITAFEYGWNQRHYEKIDENELLEIEKRFIQSLQQPKLPIAFECEVEPEYKHIDSASGDRIKNYFQNKNAGKPKTIINSEGRVELVGKYIYE
jgi:hypothetical protein